MSRAERANREAADWLITQEDEPLPSEDRARFEAWLGESDGNKGAYWRLEAAWQEADRIRALGPHDAQLLAEPPRLWRRVSRGLLALAATVALAAGLWTLTPRLAQHLPSFEQEEPVSQQAFATALGMKKLIGLQDGSRIQLNTLSVVRAQITPRRRDVWLDKGEAFFDVAHLKGQPFIVHAGDRQITVLGTKFSVRRDGDKVTVSVLEGRVRVDELKDNRLLRSSVIVGGNIAMAQGAATLVTERSEEKVQDTLSWRTGMLTFDQSPLPAIAAEFNRYNPKKMVIEGDGLEAVRISGTFPAEQPDAFARLLRDAYGFGVDDSGNEIRVTE
jgi:transmembrane sensor